jgi:hypothetical protein
MKKYEVLKDKEGYEIILGQGAYGKVKKVKSISDNEVCRQTQSWGRVLSTTVLCVQSDSILCNPISAPIPSRGINQRRH